jgi:hypothetical protein
MPMTEDLTPEMSLRELALAKRAVSTFGSFESSEDDVAACMRELRAVGEKRLAESYPSFEYWSSAFEAARVAASRNDVKALARRHLCAGHPFAMPAYKISRGAMLACAYVLQKRLYAFEASRGHRDPASAVLDAITPRRERAVAYFRVVLAEIAAESGEVLE